MVPMLINQSPRHPGQILEEEFLSRLAHQTQAEIADHLGISRPRLSLILRGKRSVTPDTALRLSRAFGTTAEFWMQAQALWDLYDAQRSRKRMRLVEQIEPLLGEMEAADESDENFLPPEVAAFAFTDAYHPGGYLREFLESEGLLVKAVRFARIRAQLEALDVRPKEPSRAPYLRLPPRDQWFAPGLPGS
jgi:antitoxin HigA-1